LTSPQPIVLITQRAIAGAGGVAHDALDRRWYAFAARWGIRLAPLANDVGALDAVVRCPQAAGLILSGGGDLSATPGGREVDDTREQVERSAVSDARAHGRPILGVCRGAQFLWTQSGGQLTRVDGHRNTAHVITPTELGHRRGLSEHRVNSFHEFGLAGNGHGHFGVLMSTRDPGGTPETFAGIARPEWGVMWHPERPGNDEAADHFVEHTFIDAVRRHRRPEDEATTCTR